MMRRCAVLILVLAMTWITSGTVFASGYTTSDGLWIGAVINTEEKGPIDALFQLGGEDSTARGDQVIWGHFYASPSDVTWGSPENPDLFVKIWFDASGRTDVNFFHVSVPDIKVLSSYGGSDQSSLTTMSARYIRQYYLDGQGYEEEGYEDGYPPAGYFPSDSPSGYFADTDLRIASVINTEEKGSVRNLEICPYLTYKFRRLQAQYPVVVHYPGHGYLRGLCGRCRGRHFFHQLPGHDLQSDSRRHIHDGKP